MMTHTRSGRPALEQARKGAGHWHIEGWCAVKHGTLKVMPWKATNGPCQYLELDAEGARWVYASALNFMRDRIREEIWNGPDEASELADRWAPLRGVGPCPTCGVAPGELHKPHIAEETQQ